MNSRTLITIRAHVRPADRATFWQIIRDFAESERATHDLANWSAYEHLTRPEILLAVLEYSAYAGDAAGTGDPDLDKMLISLNPLVIQPPSVRFITVRASGGQGPSDMATGTYLSISDRNAEPGRAAELAQDYEFVFGSLSVLPGFAGYLYGPYGGLEEKLFGFALWSDEESLRESIARHLRHQLRIYEKVDPENAPDPAQDFLAPEPEPEPAANENVPQASE
ncbi:MAG: hypothetical protein C4320_08045 [Armatimonadota bacterium]